MKLASAIVAVVTMSTISQGILPSDLNYDGVVNSLDFAAFSSQWLNEGSGTVGGIVIAASDASAISKRKADYVCDGVDDQVEIQTAIGQFPIITGIRRCGQIYLTEGTFYISSPIIFGSREHEITGAISGAGSLNGTKLKLVDNSNCSILQVGYDPRWDNTSSNDYCTPAWLNLRKMTLEGDAEAAGLVEHKYVITGVNQGLRRFTLAGEDAASQIIPYNAVRVMDSTGNDGYYIVIACTASEGETEIRVTRDIASSVADGQVKAEWPLVNAAKWQDGCSDHVFYQKSNGDGLWIKDAWTLKFNDSVFEHNNNNGLFIYCTSYYTSTNVVIDKAVFINNRPDSTAGLMVMYSPTVGACEVKGLWITDSYFRRCTRDGIHLIGAVKCFKIMGNYMHSMGQDADSTYYGIKLESPVGSNGPQRGIIANNYINCTTLGRIVPRLKAAIGLVNNSDTAYPDWIDIRDNQMYGDVPLVDTPNKPANERGKVVDVELINESFVDVSASDANSLVANLDISGGGSICEYFDAGHQMDYPRNVILTITDYAGTDLRGEAIVYGFTSYMGDTEHETFNINSSGGSSVFVGEKAWRELYMVCVNISGGTSGMGDTLQVGAGSRFLLNYPIAEEDDVVSVRKNGVPMSLYGDDPKEYYVNAYHNTIDFNRDSNGSTHDEADKIMDGDDFTVCYKKVVSLN